MKIDAGMKELKLNILRLLLSDIYEINGKKHSVYCIKNNNNTLAYVWMFWVLVCVTQTLIQDLTDVGKQGLLHQASLEVLSRFGSYMVCC